MKARIDKEAWSKESKESLSYDFAKEFYEDITYQCWKCGKTAVFSAQDQKHSFEVLKNYVWQRCKLCNSCYAELVSLQNEVKRYEGLWSKETQHSKTSAPYLASWLLALQKIPGFGKPENTASINMLKKLVVKNA